MGTQLLDGRCAGEAATREEIERLRTRVPELEANVARLENELDAAHTQSEAQAGRIADLESQLAAANGELSSLRDELARLTAYVQTLGGTPPTTPPAPIPGTAGAVADAASGTEPGPLAPIPPPSEEGEESCWEWDQACPWVLICTLIGAAGATVGIVEATRDIHVTQ